MVNTQRQMRQYQSHKKVWALKIERINISEAIGGGLLHVEQGFAPINIDKEYINKHQPKVGGYYVVYKDGYKSFSPAKAFEEGYSLIK